jgi:polyhydroxyalkanoate synthase
MSQVSQRLNLASSDAVAEMAMLTRRLSRGMTLLAEVADNGIEIATTPKVEVLRRDKTVLYRYEPVAQPSASVPVLLTYGLIGRYTMADLEEDRSLVRRLLARGLDVYVIDWGNPGRSDRWLSLEDYVDGYLDDAIAFIRERHDIAGVNLLGICEGGVLAMLYAALNPSRVRNLVLAVTPVDFHADSSDPRLGHGLLNRWTRHLAASDIDRLVAAFGCVPGDLMGAMFSMLTPVKSLTKHNIGLLEAFDAPTELSTFLRMEKWLADRPDHPGEAAKQWLNELYQQNRLAAGTLEIGGRTVRLSDLTMPVLNIYALDDHIVPPACSAALRGLVGTHDYTEITVPGGHIGVFVSRKSQDIVGNGIAEWLGAGRRRDP